ncbi:SDR family oxidoreductase [Arthrobacter sp. FW305-BF8]|uniref:NAD(P)-binding oxidoreductase n=1 Tax=Arthrobacter sp. FW305-BF8 TaxID=2879617 RepID=UPI001F3C424F|nr:NAD(P)-binding oxidoreductase [Arthrobacter sp. FW305-BF8]UKA55233.1 SDR family oxidoreductase [Arthrobacter sp. FW305-BF8]
MHVLIIGAAGGIGVRLAKALTQNGDTSTGIFRNPDHHDRVEAAGATPLIGDLIHDSVDELASKMTGHDAVVFSAGAHGTGQDQTTLIDGKGLEKAARAAAQAGALRFVLISAYPEAAANPAGISEGYAHYLRTKKGAEVYLTGTDLDWIVVRPGHLLDEPGDGLVSAGPALMEQDVRRDNVAAFIIAALHNPDLSRSIVELTDGTTPVADAVAAVAASVGPRR